MLQIANRLQSIKPSPTLAVAARAAALKAQGKDILSLSVGEPDFDTPNFIKEAAIAAIQEGFTKYTAVDGIATLKEAIIGKFTRDNHLNFSKEEILVSCGAKHSIYNALLALINPDDEVIIPAPYWVSYPDMVLLAEGKPVIVETTAQQHFKMTPDQLRQAITPKTKMLILNSPSNPTGVAYSADDLKQLSEVLLQFPNVWILSDDIYEPIYWSQNAFHNILNVAPALRARTIVVNGVSKAYSMTGWRIGYAAAPKTLIAAMTTLQSQSTSNPTSISQRAAAVALSGDQACVVEMSHVFRKRHDFVLTALKNIAGIDCVAADGAFYLFPNITSIMKQRNFADDIAFADALLMEVGVATVPGSAFGTKGHIRLSFATSQTILEDALARLKRFCA